MFGSAEMTRSTFKDQKEFSEFKRVLEVFKDEITKQGIIAGIPMGQNPFSRVCNFIALLDTQSIHIVVDDTPIGGVPDHVYADERSRNQQIKIDEVIGLSVRDLGYRDPIGLSIPANLMSKSISDITVFLSSYLINVIGQLKQHLLMKMIQMPPGFQHVGRFLPAFLKDHPDVSKNVFLMMRFRSEDLYNNIFNTIKSELKNYGLNVLRADDKDYTGDLWENVVLYMLCSGYGLAVFEEIDIREFNPNVALELGFMTATNKRCLLLKDKRMPKLPTDVVGKLYKEFDTYNIAPTISSCIKTWVRDIGLIP